jgi:hypothetical protein
MTMLEDYWLPRREGNRGTEITTLPAGQNLGEMQDVEYFQMKLFRALNVPVSRLNTETANVLGRASEISRDEVKFTKFVGRLRRRFSMLFMEALKKQLVLKGICSEEDWSGLQQQIIFDFTKDNHFEEFKDNEVMQSRITLLNQVMPYIGRYFSDMWVRKNILRMDEKEIAEMMDEMGEEKVPLTQPLDPGQPAPPPPIANKPNIPGTGEQY